MKEPVLPAEPLGRTQPGVHPPAARERLGFGRCCSRLLKQSLAQTMDVLKLELLNINFSRKHPGEGTSF